MNRKDAITNRVIEIIKENVELPEDILKMNGDTTFEDLKITSIDFIKIIVAVEAEYGFEFDDDELDYSNFNTIYDVVEYIIRVNTDERKDS